MVDLNVKQQYETALKQNQILHNLLQNVPETTKFKLSFYELNHLKNSLEHFPRITKLKIEFYEFFQHLLNSFTFYKK